MSKRSVDKQGIDSVERMLHELNSGASGAAWADFIDRYARLIMRAVRQFEYEHERANDCFLHVCEKLCENRIRRLLKFNTAGRAGLTPGWEPSRRRRPNSTSPFCCVFWMKVAEIATTRPGRPRDCAGPARPLTHRH